MPERLELEDGLLVVSGRWSGIRGLRFVRPTLVVGDQEILATLEHKPWAPVEDELWTAAFPWRGGDVDMRGTALTVAPSVTVPLGPPRADDDVPRTRHRDALDDEARTRQPDALDDDLASVRDELAAVRGDLEAVRTQLGSVTGERDALRKRLEDAESRLEEAKSRLSDGGANTRVLEDAVRREREALLELTAERDSLHLTLRAAERERDHTLELLEEERRARAATASQRDDALAERDEAVGRTSAAEAERDNALRQCDDVRGQRDEVLAAYNALRRRTTQPGDPAEPASDREQPRAAAPRTATTPPAPRDPGHEQPAGVRAIPASRTVAADLHRAEHSRTPLWSKGDIWAVRVFGSIAAVSFILLLILLLRLFV
jgi:hypothetical protein